MPQLLPALNELMTVAMCFLPLMLASKPVAAADGFSLLCVFNRSAASFYLLRSLNSV